VPFQRIKAGGRCLKLLAAQSRFETAARLGKDAIDFLPTMYTVLLGRDDEQSAIETWASLADNRCAVLLATNQTDDALQYPERGRVIIISKLLGYRVDMPKLQRDHPTLAQKYQKLVAKVNAPLPSEQTHISIKDMQRGRSKEQMGQLDACIKRIREIPGHERFLLGLTTIEMQEAASEGTIVIVNETDFQSDAIIVSSTETKAASPSQLPVLLGLKNRSASELISQLQQS
jgi:hypothetical protein